MPKTLQIAIFILLMSACEYFQYSPNALEFDESQTNLNEKNIQKLVDLNGDDTIRFVTTGDSQEATDELNELVTSVNALANVDFVLIAGDLTQDSYAREYIWTQRELEKLKVPYIAVVGNHDLRRNGEKLFQAMFGPLDFSFVYKNTKFICLNNSSYIYDWDGTVPNIRWLADEMDLAESVQNMVIVSHIPPWYPPKFDQRLEQPYAETLASHTKTLLSVHAHAGRFSYSEHYQDGVNYLLVPSIVDDPSTPVDKSYVVSTIVGNTHTYEKVSY